MYICKYCKKEFKTYQQLGGHIVNCKLNPNYQKSLSILKNARDSRKFDKIKKETKKETYICKYCGKQIGNKGCLVLHESRCIKNPNVVLSKSQIKQIARENNKGKKKKLTDEHKQKIRESLIKWKNNNPEKYLNYCRKKSVCCENFKQYLRDNNIDFVEEYTPYEDRMYTLDIAFPDEKIAIEVNGSQHYDNDGNLNQSTLEKQFYFENRGWKIIQIYYKWCYGVIKNNPVITSIFDLPIHNKNYVKEIYTRNYKKLQKQKLLQLQKEKEKEINEDYKRNIIYNLIYNSNIDFSVSGWSTKAKQYLISRNELYSKHIFQQIKKYFPDFLKQNNVWKRKGSIY